MLRKFLQSFLQSFWLPLVPGLVLITPFLSWDTVACTHDGHLHYHRVTALKVAWENGLYFPRWVPDLAFGYGFPFFMYRESVPLYLTLFPHLAGLPLPAAENLFYAGCILFGGVFTYLWVRDFAGLVPAVVSSVAYMSAPYILIDALIRGNSPESMALAMVPLLLWAGRRLMISGRRRWFVTFVLSFAIFSLSHNISLLIYTPVIFLYMAVIGWVYQLDWKLLAWRLAPAFAIALGMTAWYTGSALLEMDAVTLSLTTSKRNNSFDFNWASLAEIFAQVPFSDPNLQNPPLPIRLGWIPSLLAAIGVLRVIGSGWTARGKNNLSDPTSTLVRAQREMRWHAGLMLAAAAVFVFMSLPPSDWLWSNLPLIKFVQFPWRFVGRAALPLAVLAGLAFVRVGGDGVGSQSISSEPTRFQPRRPLQIFAILPVLAIALLVLEATPYLYTRECRESGYPTVLDIFEYERNTGMVGVDPVGGYFPVTVAVRPSETPFETDYVAGQQPQRFDVAALPDGVQLISADYGNNRATIQLETDGQLNEVEPFVGRYLTFDYPGWKVTADGQPLDIVPSEPEGLITFEVPAGTQQLEIWFGLTPFRTFLLVISGLSLLLFFVMWHPRFKPHNPPFIRTYAAGTAQVAVTSLVQDVRLPLQAIVAGGLVLLGGKFLLIDRQLTPLHRMVAPEVANPAQLSAGELRYIGYEVDRASAESGGIFNIDVGLQTDIVPQNRYQTGIRLVGPEGRTWSVTDLQRPRIYEDLPFTTYWLPNYWGWDSWEISVLPGTPPGDYDIELTVFNRDTLVPQTLSAADGSIVGPSTIIGQMVVTKPSILPDIEPQYSADVTLSDEPIKLIGFNQSQADAVPGSPLLISLFLEKVAAGGSQSLKLDLVDETGNITQNWEISPGRGTYFVPDWAIGDVVLSQHEVWLPADLVTGDYRFQLEEVLLETVSVTAPPMMTEEPAFMMETPNQKWENGIELVGFNTGEPEQTFELELIWRTDEFIDTNYRVFIHLLDVDGNIEAQSDSVPASWTRPTTGWRPGEFIVDTHVIDLPDVAYLDKVFVGLYDPNTGTRLKLVDGADSYLLR
ncbi:MAG: 6-pyruvoyl-tetrahydropterin synthase-related protein [Anaerolineae bacterium]